MNPDINKNRKNSGPVRADEGGEFSRIVPRRSIAANWWPIFLEPVVGSGERLCVGVVVVTPEAAIVHRTPGLQRLSCFYGSAAAFLLQHTEDVLFELNSSVQNLDFRAKSLDSGDLKPLSVEGFWVGTVSTGYGNSLGEIAEMALLRSSSLVETLSWEAPIQSPRLTRQILEGKVREIIALDHPGWSYYFGASRVLAPESRLVTYSFIGQNLAANFDVLSAKRLSDSRKAVQSQLWQLISYRQSISAAPPRLFDTSPSHFEMFVCLSESLEDLTPRQQDSREKTIVELKAESKTNGLPFSIQGDAQKLSQRLISLETTSAN